MSKEQLQLLKKIGVEGLIVLSSYCIKYPRYGHEYETGHDISGDEWRLIQTLWHEGDDPKAFMINGEIVRVRGYCFKSDYLEQERLKMDEDYEYHTGLQTRYILTDLAKQ